MSRRLGWIAMAGVLGTLACGGSGPSESRIGTLTVVDSTALTDTVEAPHTTELALQLIDALGNPVNGTTIAVAVPSFYLADSASSYPPAFAAWHRQEGSTVVGYTDDDGIARFTFRRLWFAGRYPIYVAVGHLGILDTLTLTVQPGHAVALRALPLDTTLYTAASTQLHAALVDRLGNPRTDPVTYVAAGPRLQVTSAGVVTAGSAYGRDSVTVQATLNGGVVQATGYISIVPVGQLAIVFRGILTTSIGTVRLDGSGLRFLTTISTIFSTFGTNASPVWSPDGSQILFSDEGGLFRVSPTAVPLRAPFGVAPPGSTQLYEGEYSSDGTEVYCSNAQLFGNLRVLLLDSTGSYAGVVTPAVPGLSYNLAWHPSPSPDGSQVAVITNEFNGGVRVITRATGQPLPWVVAGQRPRWSPTGERIAFTTIENGPLHLINPDGTGEHVITPPGVDYVASMLGWSPNGRWLVARGVDDRLSLVEASTGLTLPLGYSYRMTEAAFRP